MVALASKSVRDTIGIDSCERAVAYSILLLRDSYLRDSDPDIQNNYQFVITTQVINSEIVGILNISSTVLFDNNLLTNGGSLLDSIVEGSSVQSDYVGFNLLPSEAIATAIQEDLLQIDTLEKYFYWNCQNILANNLIENISSFSLLPRLTRNSAISNLQLSAKIKFNLVYYLKTNNLIESIGRATIIPPAQEEGNTPSVVGEMLFGNDFLVGNTTNNNQTESSLIGNTALLGNNNLIGN